MQESSDAWCQYVDTSISISHIRAQLVPTQRIPTLSSEFLAEVQFLRGNISPSLCIFTPEYHETTHPYIAHLHTAHPSAPI